jgi:hypothetical protein
MKPRAGSRNKYLSCVSDVLLLCCRRSDILTRLLHEFNLEDEIDRNNASVPFVFSSPFCLNYFNHEERESYRRLIKRQQLTDIYSVALKSSFYLVRSTFCKLCNWLPPKLHFYAYLLNVKLYHPANLRLPSDDSRFR